MLELRYFSVPRWLEQRVNACHNLPNMNISSRDILKVLVLILLFVGGVLAVYAVRLQLVWIAAAFFLAVALNPAVEKLVPFMPKRNRGLAAGSVFLAIALVFGFLISALAPPLVHQTETLIKNAPRYTDELVNGDTFVSQKIRDYNLVDRVRSSQDQIIGYVSSAGGSFVSIVSRLFSSVAAGVTIVVLTFFMLIEGPGWMDLLWRILPAKHREHWQRLSRLMYKAVTGYVTGYLFMSALAATLTGIMLAIIGVPYAIPLGILVGIFDFIPLVGATLGAVVVVIAALFSSVGAGIIMAIFFAIYQQVENHVLQPLVQSRSVQMSPLSVLISVLIGVGLAGIMGALVAIPVGASVQILLRDLASRRLAPKSQAAKS